MDDLLSELLEDYLRRRASGASPTAEEYRERAGDHYPEFVELLAGESALEEALGMEIEPSLPADFGDYTLVAELGRGAMGVVYEARHRRLDRMVAVKVMRSGFDTTPAAIERFRREAVACAQVRHDNVVEVFESGDVEGRAYYAMSLVRGRSLGELVRRGEVPEARDACRGIAGVADALHMLHEAGILHRDVKPSNIIVDEDGRMVLADFGLARTLVAATLTRTGEALGTPLYMSPEQLSGRREQIDRRADVYGLGATLYELLTGRPPFAGGAHESIVHQILTARPVAPREFVPGLPVDCERVVLKALEKEKRDRYQTAADMRDDLLAFSEGRSTTGRPVSGAVRRARWARRHWRPLAIAAVLLIAGAVFLATRPATLRIECYPQARIFVDGEPHGQTPRTLRIAPGVHDLDLRTRGFVASTERLDLGAGEKHTVRMVLVAADPNDPEALRKLAGRFRLRVAQLDRSSRRRGGPAGDAALPALPRGLIRKADGIELLVEVGPEFDAQGALVFWRGDERIHAQPFRPESLATTMPLPAAVRLAAVPGQPITWGFVSDGARGPDHTATFTVVADDPGPAVREIETALRLQPPRLVAHMRANLFLDAKLFVAAYREAEASLRVAPSEDACAIMQAALAGMQLEGSRPWYELFAYVDRLPER